MTNVNVMPMAGKGERFKKSNYKTQKPLIKINNSPMFVEASKCMPYSKKNIYIYKNHYEKKINLKSFLPNNLKKYSKFIYLKSNTMGQADTCLKANKYINARETIFVHSCDCFIKYNQKKYLDLINKNDIIIFTTKPAQFHFNNVKFFGWVSGKNNKIKNIECKAEASNNFKKDYVIVGSFAFRNKFIFNDCIKSLLLNKQKINNEYYMDLVIKEGIKKKYKVYNYVVNKHISWGTPKELNKNF